MNPAKSPLIIRIVLAQVVTASTLAAILLPFSARAAFSSDVPVEAVKRHVDAVNDAVRTQAMDPVLQERKMAEAVAERNRQAQEFVNAGRVVASPSEAEAVAAEDAPVPASGAPPLSTLFSWEMMPAYVLLAIAALLFVAGGWSRRGDRLPLR